MKKIFILILLVMLISLSACSGNKNFIVTFESNGGDAVEKMTVSQDTVIKNLEIPNKDYHIFKGWYFDSEFKEAFINSFQVETDIVLYAKWEPIQYSIRFNSKQGLFNGEEVFTISKSYGATFELPTPTKLGYKFGGWHESNTGLRFELTTMPAEDMSLYLNIGHYPQIFLPTDYSYGKDDGNGKITLYNEEELKTQRLRNQESFEEKLRGNTIFSYDLIEDPISKNLVLTPLYNGYTYSKASADYIKKHRLATVVKGFGEWWNLTDVSHELINGYGVHLNCDNSPIIINPFMSTQDFYNLSSYYPIPVKLDGPRLRELNVTSSIQFNNIYRILFTSHQQKEQKFELMPVVDMDGNPVIRGGYHDFDIDGHYLYDENGKPVQKLYGYEPRDYGKPIYSKDLYAIWIYDYNYI